MMKFVTVKVLNSYDFLIHTIINYEKFFDIS